MRISLTVATIGTLRLMASVFTRIIEGELPAHFCYRDEVVVGFMSINPIAPGHALVVPRTEVDQWIDLPTDVALHTMMVAHRLGRAQRTTFASARVGLIVAGFEVPHCHVHVVPTNSMADLDFANAARTVDHQVLAQQAESLRRALED
jgi:diadenosine tetraphosphate (Ap4A) HIT family hydrolase